MNCAVGPRILSLKRVSRQTIFSSYLDKINTWQRSFNNLITRWDFKTRTVMPNIPPAQRISHQSTVLFQKSVYTPLKIKRNHLSDRPLHPQSELTVPPHLHKHPTYSPGPRTARLPCPQDEPLPAHVRNPKLTVANAERGSALLVILAKSPLEREASTKSANAWLPTRGDPSVVV